MLIHDSCILTCQNINTSLPMHIPDFHGKENKNDHFFLLERCILYVCSSGVIEIKLSRTKVIGPVS